MTYFFPLLYSVFLFLSLSFLTFSILLQIRKTQNLEARLSEIQKKILKQSTSFANYYKLGQAYLSKRLYNKAIIAFRQALRYWDYNDKIGLCSLYNTIGFVYFKLKQYDYAIYYYKQGISFLPDYTLCLCNLAFAYEKAKYYDQAKKTYEILFSFDEENKLAQLRFQKIFRFLDLQKANSLSRKTSFQNEFPLWNQQNM